MWRSAACRRCAGIWMPVMVILIWGCAGSTGVGGYGKIADERVVYEPGQSLRHELLEAFDRAQDGVELRIHLADLQPVHKELRKWIEAVRQTDGIIRDRDKVLESHALYGVQSEGALQGLIDKLADKAERYFDAVNRNRRLFYGRRHNLAVQEVDSMLFIWFINRRHKI